VRAATPKRNPVGGIEKTTPYAIRLPAEPAEYLKKLGERDNRPLSYYLQLAMIELVERHKRQPATVL
jgi:predicted DNA-binding protein